MKQLTYYTRNPVYLVLKRNNIYIAEIDPSFQEI